VPVYLPSGFPVGIDVFVYTEDELDALADRAPEWGAAIDAGIEV
jgi:hypothetical protein